MKILFVIPTLTSGGAERALVSMLNAFDYGNYEVDLLILTKDTFYLKQLTSAVRLVKTPIETEIAFSPLTESIQDCICNRMWKLITPKIRVAIQSRINKLIGVEVRNFALWDIQKKHIPMLKEKYDFAVGYLQGTSIYYVVDKVDAKKKLGWIHNDYKMAKMNKQYDRCYFEKLDHIISVSKVNTENLAEVFPEFKDKLNTIYNIVNDKMVKKKAEEKSVFDSGYDGIKLLTIGRLHPQKGYSYALQACQQLIKNGIDIRWYVIGKGPLFKKILDSIKEMGLQNHFILMGERENPYPYLNECDIYVQPSVYEGFGIAVQEAKILNKPIIITDCPSLLEQIQNGVNGLVVEKDAESLFKGIMSLINSKERRRTFVEALSSHQYSSENEMNVVYKIMNEGR